MFQFQRGKSEPWEWAKSTKGVAPFDCLVITGWGTDRRAGVWTRLKEEWDGIGREETDFHKKNDITRVT